MSCCIFDCFRRNHDPNDFEDPTHTSYSEYTRTVDSKSPQIQNSFTCREAGDISCEMSLQQKSIEDWNSPNETRIEHNPDDDETLFPVSNHHLLISKRGFDPRATDSGLTWMLDSSSITKPVASIGHYSLAALYNDQFTPSHHRIIASQDIGIGRNPSSRTRRVDTELTGGAMGDLFVLIDGCQGLIQYKELDMLQERIQQVFDRVNQSQELYEAIQEQYIDPPGNLLL
eukprot:751449-Hanusia_phi.AAC.1